MGERDDLGPARDMTRVAGLAQEFDDHPVLPAPVGQRHKAAGDSGIAIARQCEVTGSGRLQDRVAIPLTAHEDDESSDGQKGGQPDGVKHLRHPAHPPLFLLICPHGLSTCQAWGARRRRPATARAVTAEGAAA